MTPARPVWYNCTMARLSNFASWTTDYDPTSRAAATALLEEAQAKQEFITGLIYINETRATMPELYNLPRTPLIALKEEQLRPSREALAQVMADLA